MSDTPTDAARVAAERALTAAADAWQAGDGLTLTNDSIGGRDAPRDRIGTAQAVLEWLRERADAEGPR